MNYEAWRITFQSDAQAARSAFNQILELSQEIKELRCDLASVDVAYCTAINQRDALYGKMRNLLTWLESDTFGCLSDLLDGKAGYSQVYTSCEKLRTMLKDIVDRDPGDGDRG